MYCAFVRACEGAVVPRFGDYSSIFASTLPAGITTSEADDQDFWVCIGKCFELVIILSRAIDI